MDSDERDEPVQERLAAMSYGAEEDDPYAYVMGLIRSEIDQALWEEIGSLEVPEWLRPIPPAGENGNINVERFISFIDNDGCRTFAEMIGEHVVEKVYPQIPFVMQTIPNLKTGRNRTMPHPFFTTFWRKGLSCRKISTLSALGIIFPNSHSGSKTRASNGPYGIQFQISRSIVCPLR